MGRHVSGRTISGRQGHNNNESQFRRACLPRARILTRPHTLEQSRATCKLQQQYKTPHQRPQHGHPKTQVAAEKARLAHEAKRLELLPRHAGAAAAKSTAGAEKPNSENLAEPRRSADAERALVTAQQAAAEASSRASALEKQLEAAESYAAQARDRAEIAP